MLDYLHYEDCFDEYVTPDLLDERSLDPLEILLLREEESERAAAEILSRISYNASVMIPRK